MHSKSAFFSDPQPQSPQYLTEQLQFFFISMTNISIYCCFDSVVQSCWLLISGFPAFVVVGAEQKTLHLNLGGWRLWEKKTTALSTGSSIEKGKAFHLICKNESLSYLGSQCYSLQARLFSDLLSDSGLVCALLSAHESCCVVSLVAVCKPLTLHQSAVTHSDPCLGTGPALTMLMAD